MIVAELAIIVDGKPAPKGSLKCVGRDGRHQLVEDNARTKPWRAAVTTVASEAVARAGKGEPIGVEVTSTLARPLSHFRADHSLKDTAPPFPVSRRTGDVDKLARLVLDALQDAGVMPDDAQVVEVMSRKVWARSETPDALDKPGAVVRVYPINGPWDL